MATIDVRDFAGADGSTTSGIQEAINALPASGGTVEIPAGTFPLTSTIKTTAAKPVVLAGAGRFATILTMSSTYKDLNMVELKGDFSQVRGLSLIGGAVAGKGRGVQMGRAVADSTGAVCQGYLLDDLYINKTPSYGVGVYGDTAANEVTENTVDTNVNALSITIDSTVNRVRIESPKGGGLYVGRACTTFTARKMSIRDWDVSAAIKYDCDYSVIEDCICEGPATEQVYLKMTGLGNTMIRPYCEQDLLTVPTKYFIDIVNAGSTTIIRPIFIRHTGTGGVCLFVQADVNCQATGIYDAFAQMGVNSTGDVIKANGSPVTLNGYKKIKQPSGYVDMAIT